FYLGIFAISLVLSFFLTREVRDRAIARGWVAAPVAERHVHQQALPRLGGVAICLAFVGSALLPKLAAGTSIHKLVAILIPATLVFLLGIYDDIHTLGPYSKFAIQ